MKFKDKGHKNLMKLLHARFNEADEDDRGFDEDADDTDEQEDALFEDNGFGDPMDTYVDENPRKRNKAPYDDYSQDDDTSDDYDSLEEQEDEEDMDDEDMRPSKGDRKNLAVIMLGKKVGRSKAKKM